MGLISGYRRLWRAHVAVHWKALLLVLVLMIVAAAAAALYAKFVQLMFVAFDARDLGFLTYAPVMVLGLALMRGLSQFAQVLMTNHVMLRIQADLQKRLHEHLIAADLAFLQRESAAAYASRLWADSGVVISSLTSLLSGLANVLTVLATFVMMLTIDWFLTVLVFAVFGLAIWPLMKIGVRVRRNTSQVQKTIGDLTAETHEGLSSMRLVRTYSLEERLRSQGAEVIERLRRARILVANWQARVEPMMEFLGGISSAALLALVVWQIKADTGSLANFMALLTGLGVVSTPARRLGSVYTSAQAGVAALERIYEILDQRNEITQRADARDPGKVAGQLSFVDVGFAYADGTVALSDINLDIPPGTKVAFVGRSGAGKSSLFNMLPRLFDPTVGQLTLDGADLRDLTLDGLRGNIAVVSQDSVLLTGTVAENIAFGRPDADRASIEEAARDAEAHEFISALANGYDTMIRPSEAAFSGGEKQRLSIARAILRDAPILLLDEPTSALDASSEASIRGALTRLSDKRTTLVIAHRLATILDSDLIVVMDKGRIAETGTHSELIAKGGIYAELYHLQFDEKRAL